MRMVFSFIVALYISIPLYAAFNESGIEWCTNLLSECINAFASTNDTDKNYTGCQQPFSDCMSNYAYLDPVKSRECYLAEGATSTLKVVASLTACTITIGAFILPPLLKKYAKCMNRWAKADAEHPCKRCIGEELVEMNDEDGDGEVKPKEVLSPQVAYVVVTLAALTPTVGDYYRAWALCDYENSLPPQ